MRGDSSELRTWARRWEGRSEEPLKSVSLLTLSLPGPAGKKEEKELGKRCRLKKKSHLLKT